MTDKKSTLKKTSFIFGGLVLGGLVVSVARSLFLSWSRRKSSVRLYGDPNQLPVSDRQTRIRQTAPFRHYSRSNPYHYIGYTG